MALWQNLQNLWVRMAHSSSRQASPLRVATGGDASWKLVAAARLPAAGMLERLRRRVVIGCGELTNVVTH